MLFFHFLARLTSIVRPLPRRLRSHPRMTSCSIPCHAHINSFSILLIWQQRRGVQGKVHDFSFCVIVILFFLCVCVFFIWSILNILILYKPFPWLSFFLRTKTNGILFRLHFFQAVPSKKTKKNKRILITAPAPDLSTSTEWHHHPGPTTYSTAPCDWSICERTWHHRRPIITPLCLHHPQPLWRPRQTVKMLRPFCG